MAEDYFEDLVPAVVKENDHSVEGVVLANSGYHRVITIEVVGVIDEVNLSGSQGIIAIPDCQRERSFKGKVWQGFTFLR